MCAALLKNLRGCFDFAILCHAQPMVSVTDALLEMLVACLQDPQRAAASAGAKPNTWCSRCFQTVVRLLSCRASSHLSPTDKHCRQIFHPALAADMLPELQVPSSMLSARDLAVRLQVFLHLMLDLTNAERSLWGAWW